MAKQQNPVVDVIENSKSKPAGATDSGSSAASQRTRVSQSDVPAVSLEQALRVPKAIFDNYAGNAVTPFDLAKALDMTKTSGSFRMLTGAAIAYGLVEGGYGAETITPTELAKQIFRPLEEGQDRAARKRALLTPRVVREFLTKYDENALPREDIAMNVLGTMGVPEDRAKGVLGLILAGAKDLGLLVALKGKDYIQLSGAATAVVELPPEEASRSNASLEDYDLVEDVQTARVAAQQPSENKRVFITHGKNKSLIEPIKKLLAFGELEPVVAVESASVSKPVPDKVMSDMRSCSGAIIHVDAERELMDKDANAVRVLNENVLIEIGAAMALYGRRFILLVRDGVALPSNLQGLFEVRYTADDLGADKTIELLDAINKLKKEPVLQH